MVKHSVSHSVVGVAVDDVPRGVVDHPDHHPVARAVLVEARCVDDRVEAAPQAVPDVVGAELVPPVPQHRRELVVRVAAHRLGVDDQPRLAVARQHVVVVQVAVDDHADRRGVGHQVSGQRHALLAHPPRDRRVRGQRLEVGGPALDVRRDRAQLRKRGHVDPRVEAGHDLAGLEVADRRQVARVQPFEQHRPPMWVGPQQQDGAVAVPVLEGEVLEVATRRRGPRVQLQHGALAVAGDHRDDERAVAVHQGAVDGQRPTRRGAPG